MEHFSAFPLEIISNPDGINGITPILTEDGQEMENQQSNGRGYLAIDMTRENSRDSNASFATFPSGTFKRVEFAF